MNIIKTQLTNLLLVSILANSETDEIILQEFYNVNDTKVAEKKFLDFWEFCLLTFSERKTKVNKYKIIQAIVNFEKDDGDVHVFKDQDKVLNFDQDNVLLLKRNLDLCNIKVYKNLCKLYDVEVSKEVTQIEKTLQKNY